MGASCAEGGEDADGDGRSKYNTWEAQYAVGLAQYLMLQGIKPGEHVWTISHQCWEATVVASERDEEELAQVEAQGDEDAAREDLAGQGLSCRLFFRLAEVPTRMLGTHQQHVVGSIIVQPGKRIRFGKTVLTKQSCVNSEKVPFLAS
eukprot:466454-Pelagomonas_calceolata.AAC.5